MHTPKSVLDKKIDQQTNQELFLVNWKNAGKSILTWEPFHEIQNLCSGLVDQFQKQFGHLKTTCIGKVYVPPKNIFLHQNKSRNNKLLARNFRRRQKQRQLNLGGYALRQNKKLAEQQLFSRSMVPNKNMNFPPKQSFKQKNPIDILSKENKREQTKSKKSQPDESQFNVNVREDFQPNVNDNNDNLNSSEPSVNQIQQNYQKMNPKSRQQNNEPQGKNQIKFSDERAQEKYVLQANQMELIKKQQPDRRWPQQGQFIENKFKEESQNLKIIGMKHNPDGKLKFFIQNNNIRGWCSHSYLLENFPKSLCLFYQKYIQFV